MNDLTGALATLKAAVNMDPNYADIHLFYAQLLQNTGNLAEAKVIYQGLLTTDPTNATYSTAIKAIEASLTAGASGTTTP